MPITSFMPGSLDRPAAAVFGRVYKARADYAGPMAEARLEGGVPQTAGWFVVNAADAPWMHNEMRAVCKFGGEGPGHFDDLGIALYWLEPGQPMAMYHHEAGQEDFLVLKGRALLIVE